MPMIGKITSSVYLFYSRANAENFLQRPASRITSTFFFSSSSKCIQRSAFSLQVNSGALRWNILAIKRWQKWLFTAPSRVTRLFRHLNRTNRWFSWLMMQSCIAVKWNSCKIVTIVEQGKLYSSRLLKSGWSYQLWGFFHCIGCFWRRASHKRLWITVQSVVRFGANGPDLVLFLFFHWPASSSTRFRRQHLCK